MSSIRCLVQVRSSLSALGTKILTTNSSKLLCYPSSTLLHTLVNDITKTKNDVAFLRATPLRSHLPRWESNGHPTPPECNHWSKQWEKDRLAKKRFSNEGKYFRSVFTRRTGEELWKSVVTQSNAAAKSGRGKRGKMRRRIDLNRGQKIGDGPSPWTLPGLNAPLSEKVAPQPENEEYFNLLSEQRKLNERPLRRRQHPLERGWTSAKFGGRKLGPPDPIGEQSFEEFETYVLEFKRVCHMDATAGRKYSYTCLVVTGNGKGLAGFAMGKSSIVNQAQSKARNKAILRLQYVNMNEGHTIFHKIYSKFHASHLFIEPRPEGHGVRGAPIHCHRVISTICKALGLKDLSVVVEHSKENTLAMVRGFFAALRAQKTIQQLSDEMRLHCVEYRAENDFWPTLIASPRPEIGPVRYDSEVGTQEYRDLDLVLNGGRTTDFPPVGKPPWSKICPNYLDKDRWSIYKHRHQEASELRRHILFSEDYPSKIVVHYPEESTEEQ